MIAGKPLGRPSGFTLIELLVTIAVAVILATVAVPGFQSLVTTNRQAADFNEILTSLTYARSEAVKRRENIAAQITLDNESGAWRIEVVRDDDVLMVREARDGRVLVSEAVVIFNSLGRRNGCEIEGEADPGCEIDVGDRSVVIGPSGRIERG
ncbi:prepilin-type N-terminal cleavage/methylation domain-containing protein [Halomonas sp. JS92-SW72]|nr:prepilin-type N-terminal cleavage/methylation domain-containing protein [Halomonas sp. JS92-SW72]